MENYGFEIRTQITSNGVLKLWLETTSVPTPAPDEVLIRVEAAPINPSDIILLLGPADLSTLESCADGGICASVPREKLELVKSRLDYALPVGNEGAGTVIDAGSHARELVGRTVAARSSRGMYAQYRLVKASECLVLPAGVTARQGASAFINPLTALGMVETMRREGHSALVHTAAASSVGRMLNRLCIEDGVPLINIVRSAAQAELLRSEGAAYVADMSSESFERDLLDALKDTAATLAFDAVGGGGLAEAILAGMEQVAGSKEGSYSRYGSRTRKQVYIYGVLDPGPTTLTRSYGMAWRVGGWLMTWFMESLEPAAAKRLRDCVAERLTTTFCTEYSAEISLEECLSPGAIRAYARRGTASKYLLMPWKNRT